MARFAVVTGANKGIGKSVCEKLARDHGFSVFLGSRDAARGRAAVADIKSKIPEADVRLLELDVTSAASIAAAVDAVKAVTGEVAVLVNNAGGAGAPGISDLAGHNHTISLNVRGVKAVTEAFLPLLLSSGTPGRIGMVGSGAASGFVSRCSPERQQLFVDPAVTWEQLEGVLQAAEGAYDGGLSGDAVAEKNGALGFPAENGRARGRAPGAPAPASPPPQAL